MRSKSSVPEKPPHRLNSLRYAITLSNSNTLARLREARTHHHPLHHLADRGTASAAAATMVLEATMICVDNSEYMRNGDYRPSRFVAQANAVAVVCGAKMQDKQSTVGLLAMAGAGVRVLLNPTSDFGKLQSSLHGLQIGGEAKLIEAIKLAHIALKHRQNKQLQQRIIVFVGSPVINEQNALEEIGKNLRKNNVALDVVDFGESDNEKTEKLEALVAAVNSGGNSNIIHIPAGYVLTDVIISSPILSEDQGIESDAAAASGASGFEFGVDPNVDPDLVLALRISMEEERARQEAAAETDAEELSETESEGQCSTSEESSKTESEDQSSTSEESSKTESEGQSSTSEDSFKTESEGQSSTSNGDTVMADAESEPDPTEDKRPLQTLLERQAPAMSTEDATRIRAAKILASMLKAKENGTQTMSNVFGNCKLSDDDLNDLCDMVPLECKEPLFSPTEAKKQHKKHERQQVKKRKRKHEEEDEPEGDNSQ